MAEGDVQSSTLATGSYQTASYRGIIRSASVAQTSQSVMAVEIHFETAEYQETISFNGYHSRLWLRCPHQVIVLLSLMILQPRPRPV